MYISARLSLNMENVFINLKRLNPTLIVISAIVIVGLLGWFYIDTIKEKNRIELSKLELQVQSDREKLEQQTVEAKEKNRQAYEDKCEIDMEAEFQSCKNTLGTNLVTGICDNDATCIRLVTSCNNDYACIHSFGYKLPSCMCIEAGKINWCAEDKQGRITACVNDKMNN